MSSSSKPSDQKRKKHKSESNSEKLQKKRKANDEPCNMSDMTDRKRKAKDKKKDKEGERKRKKLKSDYDDSSNPKVENSKDKNIMTSSGADQNVTKAILKKSSQTEKPKKKNQNKKSDLLGSAEIESKLQEDKASKKKMKEKRRREDKLKVQQDEQSGSDQNSIPAITKEKGTRSKDMRSKAENKAKTLSLADPEQPPSPPNLNPLTTTNTDDQDSSMRTSGWNNWNAASFGGDGSRKSKFLRLLGAGKSSSNNSDSSVKKKGLYGSLVSGSSSNTIASAIDGNYEAKMNDTLEKQFLNGLELKKMKQKGKSLGLGFK